MINADLLDMTCLLSNLVFFSGVCLAAGQQQHAAKCASLVQKKQWITSLSANVSWARPGSSSHPNVSLSEDTPVKEVSNISDSHKRSAKKDIPVKEVSNISNSHKRSAKKGNSSAPESTRIHLNIKVPNVTLTEENQSDVASDQEVFPSIHWGRRVRPQLKSILMMMLMPLGSFAIVYCTFLLIRIMEKHAAEASEVDASHENHGQAQAELPDMKYYAPLTEELVSPGRSECTIALPSLARIKPSSARNECDIVSKTGNPIVRVVVTCMANTDPEGAAGGSRGSPGQVVERIELISAKKQNPLGYCEIQVAQQPGASDSGGRLIARIFQHTGDLFALLEEVSMFGDSPLHAAPGEGQFPAAKREFTVSSANAAVWQRKICGNVVERLLSVTDEAGERIISVEPGGGGSTHSNIDHAVPSAAHSYKLRIQPKVDAGVIIAALLAIDRITLLHRM